MCSWGRLCIEQKESSILLWRAKIKTNNQQQVDLNLSPTKPNILAISASSSSEKFSLVSWALITAQEKKTVTHDKLHTQKTLKQLTKTALNSQNLSDQIQDLPLAYLPLLLLVWFLLAIFHLRSKLTESECRGRSVLWMNIGIGR